MISLVTRAPRFVVQVHSAAQAMRRVVNVHAVALADTWAAIARVTAPLLHKNLPFSPRVMPGSQVLGRKAVPSEPRLAPPTVEQLLQLPAVESKEDKRGAPAAEVKAAASGDAAAPQQPAVAEGKGDFKLDAKAADAAIAPAAASVAESSPTVDDLASLVHAASGDDMVPFWTLFLF